MSGKDNGGAAFPTPWVNAGDDFACSPDGQLAPPGESVYMPGMSLRDYFAANAVQGTLGSDRDMMPREHARMAYEIADAMLEARK